MNYICYKGERVKKSDIFAGVIYGNPGLRLVGLSAFLSAYFLCTTTDNIVSGQLHSRSTSLEIGGRGQEENAALVPGQEHCFSDLYSAPTSGTGHST